MALKLRLGCHFICQGYFVTFEEFQLTDKLMTLTETFLERPVYFWKIYISFNTFLLLLQGILLLLWKWIYQVSLSSKHVDIEIGIVWYLWHLPALCWWKCTVALNSVASVTLLFISLNKIISYIKSGQKKLTFGYKHLYCLEGLCSPYESRVQWIILLQRPVVLWVRNRPPLSTILMLMFFVI